MRIISGSHKGRRIVAPKKLPVRPTTDRSKEGLFNILSHRLQISDLKILDLFSGTGNISYEFASRGAKEITSVDQNRYCSQFIHQTAQNLELNLHVIQSEVISFLEKTKTNYDIIFADPPYDWEENDYQRITTLALQKLRQEGLLILEHSNHLDLSNLKNFDCSRAYGGSVFSFFE